MPVLPEMPDEPAFALPEMPDEEVFPVADAPLLVPAPLPRALLFPLVPLVLERDVSLPKPLVPLVLERDVSLPKPLVLLLPLVPLVPLVLELPVPRDDPDPELPAPERESSANSMWPDWASTAKSRTCPTVCPWDDWTLAPISWLNRSNCPD